jgi:hypothetical protein
VTREAARQRAELEETIRGETVCDALRRTAADLADDPALSDRTGDGWHTLTQGGADHAPQRAVRGRRGTVPGQPHRVHAKYADDIDALYAG